MSRLRLIIFAETKAHYLVSGKRNIPPTLMVERFAIIPGRTLRTVTYPPPRLATMGVKLSLPRLFTNTYIRVIDTHTYMYIYARVENARVFITARYRPNIIFAARASTATSLVLCLSALVALTRATLTSPRTLTYLLTYFTREIYFALEKSRGWRSFDFSRGLSRKAGTGPIFGRRRGRGRILSTSGREARRRETRGSN